MYSTNVKLGHITICLLYYVQCTRYTVQCTMCVDKPTALIQQDVTIHNKIPGHSTRTRVSS